MALRFPCDESARYLSQLSDDIAEYEIDSPCSFADDGRPDLLNVLVGTMPGWEFCCVEAIGRCPVWDEMKWVRDLCFDAEDCAMQLHPPASRYINASEFALWIWRPTSCAIPLPPLWRERAGGPLAGESKPLARAARNVQQVNAEMLHVHRDKTMTPAAKRERLDALIVEKNALLKASVHDAEAAKRGKR